MTTKLQLIERINLIDNDDHLKAILEYLQDSDKSSIRLSEKDLQAIALSNQQISNGQFITQEQLVKKVNLWLGK